MVAAGQPRVNGAYLVDTCRIMVVVDLASTELRHLACEHDARVIEQGRLGALGHARGVWT